MLAFAYRSVLGFGRMKEAHERLAAWRARKGLSLAAASALCGDRWWNWRRYESGERVPPTHVAAKIESVMKIRTAAWPAKPSHPKRQP